MSLDEYQGEKEWLKLNRSTNIKSNHCKLVINISILEIPFKNIRIGYRRK